MHLKKTAITHERSECGRAKARLTRSGVRRNTFIALSILVASMFLATSVSHAQSEYDNSEGYFSAGIVGTFGGSGSYDIHPIDWFKNTLEDVMDEPIKKPKNIYNLMKNLAREKPIRQALKRSLDQHGLTAQEKQDILQGKDISRIPGYSSTLDVSAYLLQPLVRAFEGDEEQLLRDIQEGRFKFDAGTIGRTLDLFLLEVAIENEVATLESELEGEITTTEIFADGDEGNSGFDLLADLQIIELLIFGEPITLTGASGPGNPPGANEVAIGDFANLQPDEEGDESGGGGGSGTFTALNQGAAGGAVGGAARPFTPIECYADANFDRGVRDFDERQAADGGASGEASSGTPPPGGQPASGPGASIGATPIESAENLSAEEIRQPASPADWRRDIFCPAGNIWCFKFETVMKRESAYPPDENCIACHVEKINDAYNRTVKSNLVPSKATGDLIEIPMCKKGWSLPEALNFNFVAIPSPILTPPNDDLVVKDVFLGSIDEFFKKYFRWEPDLVGSVQGVEGKLSRLIDDDAEEKAGDRATTQKTGQTATGAIAEINAEVAAGRAEAMETLRKQRVIEKAKGQLRFYQALEDEVNQMNGYFKSFSELFNKVIEPDGPCDTLLNKEYCS